MLRELLVSYVSSWFIRFHDASSCFIMVHYGSSCFIMFHNGSLCFVMFHHVSCLFIIFHHVSSWFIRFHQDSSWFIRFHDVSWCFIKIHHVSSWFITFNHVSWRFVMFHDVPWCFIIILVCTSSKSPVFFPSRCPQVTCPSGVSTRRWALVARAILQGSFRRGWDHPKEIQPTKRHQSHIKSSCLMISTFPDRRAPCLIVWYTPRLSNTFHLHREGVASFLQRYNMESELHHFAFRRLLGKLIPRSCRGENGINCTDPIWLQQAP